MRLNRDKLQLNLRKRNIKYYMKRVKILLYRFLNNQIDTIQFELFFKDILLEINTKTTLTRTNEHWFFWEYFYVNFKVFINYYFKPRFSRGLFQVYNNLSVTIRP